MSHVTPRWLRVGTIAALAMATVVGLVSTPAQATSTSHGKPSTSTVAKATAAEASSSTIVGKATETPAAQLIAAQVLYVKTGYGIKVDGHWFGSYINNGRISYCVSPLKGLNRGQSASTISIWSLVGATRSYELEYVLAQWGSTTDPNSGAATYDALNRIVGTSMGATAWASFKVWEAHAPAAIRTAAAARVNSAVLYHGPYRTTVKVTQQALVGQAGTAVVTVFSAAGHGITAKVALSASGATIAKAVTTNRGTATVHFTVTTAGTVTLAAQATSLPPTSMLFSHPATDQQQLLSWSPKVNSNRATTSFHKATARPTASYACTTDCAGNPVNTITKCKEAGTTIAQMLAYVNGKLRIYADFPASKSTVCKTLTTRIADTNKVVVYFRYYVNHKWTPSVALLSYVVDCPPLPNVTATISCNCTNASLVFTLPVNGTKHLEEIVVNGKQVATAKPGAAATYSVAVTRGKNSSFSFTSGIQNSAGTWHVGTPLTITVP